MGNFDIKATSRGGGFSNADVAYSAIGIDDVTEANGQIRRMFAADEAIVFFTCANIAATKIREKAHLYETFSRDELDGVMFHCMDVYKKLKEKRPYDGSVPFEVYVAKFVLPMGRQAYAASKETDNDHLVSTARNSKGEKLMQVYDLPNLHGVVAIDDSLDNCLDIYKHGGTPILVRQDKNNPYGFATVKSLKPESIMRELEKCGYLSNNDYIYQKTKILTR